MSRLKSVNGIARLPYSVGQGEGGNAFYFCRDRADIIRERIRDGMASAGEKGKAHVLSQTSAAKKDEIKNFIKTRKG